MVWRKKTVGQNRRQLTPSLLVADVYTVYTMFMCKWLTDKIFIFFWYLHCSHNYIRLFLHLLGSKLGSLFINKARPQQNAQASICSTDAVMHRILIVIGRLIVNDDRRNYLNDIRKTPQRSILVCSIGIGINSDSPHFISSLWCERNTRERFANKKFKFEKRDVQQTAVDGTCQLALSRLSSKFILCSHILRGIPFFVVPRT